MLRICIDIFAKTLSSLPESWLKKTTEVIGNLCFTLFKKRRRIVISNLRHAFPDLEYSQIELLARRSVERMLEMSLLSFCAGKFCNKRVAKCLEVPRETQDFFDSRSNDTRPVIYLVPHFTLMAMQPWLKTVVPSQADREITCIYRPLNQAALEDHIRASREKHGTAFRSRKEGFVHCMQSLRRGGQVSILFDQNARGNGALVTFMDRLCSATDLPGILAKKFKPEIRVMWVERTAFWRGRLRVEALPEEWTTSPETITAGAQLWLEKLFETSPEQIPDWLWSHKRWGAESEYFERFSLQNRKVWLETSAQLKGYSKIPRQTRVVMHLPDKSEEVDHIVPILEKIREHRPDMAFWIMSNADSVSKLSIQDLADETLVYDTQFQAIELIQSLRTQYVDIICDWVVDSKLRKYWKAADCPQTFGIVTADKKSHGFTQVYLPKPEDGYVSDFSELSLRFAEYFGLPK